MTNSELMFNSASSICNCFFVCWCIALHLSCSLFLIISEKPMGAVGAFKNPNIVFISSISLNLCYI